MAYSVIDKVYTIFIDVMTGSSNGYGKPTFYNTDSHTSFIELTVTNGSKEFNMTEFSYMFTVEKPDGTKYTNEYTTTDKSKLVIPVDAQMISCTGNCNAQLYVNKEVDGVNKTLTMVEFNYTVYKGLHEGLISESVDFDNVYIKILNKLDHIINNGADLTGEQAKQLADAYKHSQSPHAPANIVETMHTEIGEAIDAHHKKVALSASQVGSYEGTDITIKPSNEGLTKDIVVKGRTMQNIFPSDSNGMDIQSATTISNGVITCRPTTGSFCYAFEDNATLYKDNTKYTIVIDIIENTLVRASDVAEDRCSLTVGNSGASVLREGASVPILGKKGRIVLCLSTRERVSEVQNNRGVRIFLNSAFESGLLKYSVMVLEGDYTQEGAYIPPYFEGIKSMGEPTPEGGTKVVYGSCGKNLLKTGTFEVQATETGSTQVVLDKVIERNIEVDPKKTYRLSYTTNKEELKCCKVLGCNIPIPHTVTYHNTAYTFCTNNGGAERSAVISGYKYLTITTGGLVPSNIVQVGETVTISELQLEEGTEVTAYEPYQEDIKEVTVNLAGGLKGLSNGIQDYLYSNKAYNNNLYLAQVVGSYTFTGDESSIRLQDVYGDVIRFDYIKEDVKVGGDILCNRFTKGTISEADTECINIHSSDTLIQIQIKSSKLSTPDVEGFKAWLKANPTTVYYELANHSYSEVSTDTFNLKTFNGATHVFSKHDFKPTISFSTDFIPMTTDAKQYCTADNNKSFILPDIASLQDSNALEIHLFVKMLANATLSFPSNILWNDLVKMNEVTKGSTAEFIFTYIKTAEGGSWLGTVVPHK